MWRKGRGNFSQALSRHLLNESCKIFGANSGVLMEDPLALYKRWSVWQSTMADAMLCPFCRLLDGGFYLGHCLVLFSLSCITLGEASSQVMIIPVKKHIAASDNSQRCADIQKGWVCTQTLQLQWSLRTADSANSFTKTWEGTWARTIEWRHTQISDPRNCEIIFIVLNCCLGTICNIAMSH